MMARATPSLHRRGAPRRPLRAEDIDRERFMAFVEVLGPDDCWPWQGTISNGYGLFRVGGRKGPGKFGAHRVAFALEHGEAPAGLLVCHSCDNPPCCNGAHLFSGSSVVNIADAISKGRIDPRWTPKAA